MEEEARKADGAAFPLLAGYSGPLERMGGLTNVVFRAGDAVLRVPGKGTEEYIDRANEAVAARAGGRSWRQPGRAVCRSGDRRHGDAVRRRHGDHDTRSVPHTPGAPARAGQAFRQLHEFRRGLSVRASTSSR